MPYLALPRAICAARTESSKTPPQVGGLCKGTMEYFLHPRYWLLPSAQLLRFSLLSTLEIIVGLHKEKPSMLPVADRTCFL
jgi:hypothetical protein